MQKNIFYDKISHIYNRRRSTVQRLYLITVIVCLGALTFAFYGCKKKEEVPTAETAETAETAVAEEVTCPAPGDDLICEECQTLFMTDQEYASHMEATHPEKWGKMKDKFWEMREGEKGGEGPE